MQVVADTTPINYLILIGQIELLSALYTEVVLPSAVAMELRHHKAPNPVRAWIETPPSWCIVRQAIGQPDDMLMQLGAGESEAILLAQEIQADAFLTDDLEGRGEALRRGIPVTGTLGLLDRASLRGLIDLPTVIAQLQATSFFAPQRIIADMLARDAQRKEGSR